MDIPSSLKPIARAVAETLVAALPDRDPEIDALEDGHVEVILRAPPGSQAYALVAFTSADDDIWVRFGPPRACYAVDDTDELLQIVDLLLNEKVVFVVTYAGDRWAETTLMAPGKRPALKRGQNAFLFSWTGSHDAELHY